MTERRAGTERQPGPNDGQEDSEKNPIWYMASYRRVAALQRQLAASSTVPRDPILLTDEQVQAFIVRGFLDLGPVDGVDHNRVYAKLCDACHDEPNPGNNITARVHTKDTRRHARTGRLLYSTRFRLATCTPHRPACRSWGWSCSTRS